MVLEILYKICLGLIFILVTLWFFLHLLHFPPRIKYDKIGIFSYQNIFFLHFGQNDLPLTTPPFNGSL